MKCEIGGEIEAKIKHLSDPSKYTGWSEWGCTRIPGNQYNAKFVYVGSSIISYIHNHEEDFNIKNPFDSSDNIPVNQNGNCLRSQMWEEFMHILMRAIIIFLYALDLDQIIMI